MPCGRGAYAATIACRQGDIVLVSFPVTDLTSSERRPALVLFTGSLNTAGTVIVMLFVRHRNVKCRVTSDESDLGFNTGSIIEYGTGLLAAESNDPEVT